MQAIFRGRRYVVTGRTSEGIWLERFAGATVSERHFVTFLDRDLIVRPSVDDLDLAAMFERGDVGAFEYADGHTFPPGNEIPPRMSRLSPRRFPVH